MTPITKDPKRRIRRISRYASEWHRHVSANLKMEGAREKLYAMELAWLCDYALRITADHGRTTSRLGEAEMALRRIGAAVREISPQASPRSTPDTLAWEVESACRIVEGYRAEKKRS